VFLNVRSEINKYEKYGQNLTSTIAETSMCHFLPKDMLLMPSWHDFSVSTQQQRETGKVYLKNQV
jgi:hypothetical protein